MTNRWHRANATSRPWRLAESLHENWVERATRILETRILLRSSQVWRVPFRGFQGFF